MAKAKRNLFEELKKGISEMKAHRQGKITLKQLEIVTSEIIRKLREKLHLSRGVFALRLRASVRTLENWESGRTKPNDQASALMLMVKRFPQTLNYLEKI